MSDGLETNSRALQAERRESRENERGHGGSRRPLPWLEGATSVAATIVLGTFRAHVPVSSSFFLSRRRSSPTLLSVLFEASPHEFRSVACTSQRCMKTGGVLLGPFPLFVAFLCSAEDFHAWQHANFKHSSFVVVRSQQSSESSVWPHSGTKSGGGISSVFFRCFFD